jgi:protein TonB
MEANKILQSDLLDLVFEDRNKEYGAYELRSKYNKRILTAIGITAALLLLAFGSTFAFKAATSSDDDKLIIKDKELAKIEAPPPDAPPPPPPPPPPPKPPPPPPQVEMKQFTPPIIKKDEEVKKQEMPPVEELQDTKISTTNQEGVKDPGIVNVPVPPDAGSGVIAPPAPKVDENEVFNKVEIEAKVDPKLWRKHLERNLQPLADNAGSEGMEPGVYTIQVRFLVERDGSITDVTALSDPGHGLKKGVEDVVRKGPKWEPGEQNGRKVRSYHTQPITFQIAEQ